MKKILLDCGTHHGEGLNQLIRILKIDDTWEVHSFEANSNTFKENNLQKYPPNFHFFNKAVFVKDGIFDFNIETNVSQYKTGVGSSLLNEKEFNPWIDVRQEDKEKCFFEKTKIECIDFSNYVLNLLDFEIYCKMDIEGAEFEILEKMIHNESIKKIKTLFVEFHERFFINQDEYIARKQNIINNLKNRNINLIEWN